MSNQLKLTDKGLKTEIEAILYMAGRPINLQELKRTTKKGTSEIKTALMELIRDYTRRETALTITQPQPSSYLMMLKDDFSRKKHIMEFMPQGYLSEGLLKTLSLIAANQPITMYQLMKERGSHSYKHVRELEDKKFIRTRLKGRTKLLETTDYFATYFCLSGTDRNQDFFSEIITSHSRPPAAKHSPT